MDTQIINIQSGKCSDVVDELRKLPFMKSASEGQLNELAQIAFLEQVPANLYLFHGGDVADKVRLIIKGDVNLSYNAGKLEETVVTSLHKGEFLGWSGLLPGGTYSATARTREASCFVTWDAETLREVYESNCELGYLMMKNALADLAGRLEDAHRRLIDIYGKSY